MGAMFTVVARDDTVIMEDDSLFNDDDISTFDAAPGSTWGIMIAIGMGVLVNGILTLG